jgi:hypothetical protein
MKKTLLNNVHKDKKMLVFGLIFHWLWTGGVSSISSVAFLGFLEPK